MNILIISRCTYPQQGPRAFRTAELSEQLARMGHNVTVYVVKCKFDYSSYERETGVKVKFIHTLFSTTNSDGTGRHNFFDRVLFHLFHKTLEFPDIELMYRMTKVLKQETNVDLLISIAYPHPIHWGVARALNKHGVNVSKKWIADCGDPYMFNPFINAPGYFEKIERKWCSMVDYVTVPTTQSINGYYPEYKSKIKVIPQGFDFNKTPIVSEYTKNKIPTFVYAGAFYEGIRDPYAFIKYLGTINIDFKFIIYTREDLKTPYNEMLGDKLVVIKNKTRKEIIYEASKADFLINILNGNSIQSPSKLIDYYIAKRPILDISTNFSEQKQFQEFISGDYSSQHYVENGEDFKIENVANEFLKLV